MGEGLFTGKGSFSHTNESLLAAVRVRHGAMQWFDAQSAADAPGVIAMGVGSGLCRAPSSVRNPRRLYHGRIQTNSAFDAMSAAARRAAETLDAAYVLQTQGLFNGRRDGHPFFIYTDYTELANRHANRAYRVAPRSWLARERGLYDEAERIFAGSRAARESLVVDYGVPEARTSLVHTGLNVGFPTVMPERGPGVRVLFVGVDWERKGGPDMLAAFKILRRESPTAELRVVGPQIPRNAPPGVSFLGRMSPAEVCEQLREATVFCLPARHEPAGIAYSEASAWGLPVVATTAGNIPDRVVHERTGLLVAPGDHQAIAEALLDLARDEGLRRRLGEAGRAYTLSRFTWERIAEVMHEEMSPHLQAVAPSGER